MKWAGGERPLTEAFSRFRASWQKQKEAPTEVKPVWERRRDQQLADRSRLQEAASLIIQQTKATEALELTDEEVPILAEHVAFSLTREPWSKNRGLSNSYKLGLRVFNAFPVQWQNLYPPLLDPEIIIALRSFSYTGKNIADYTLSHIGEKKQFASILQNFLDEEPLAQEKLQTFLADIPPLNASSDPNNPTRHLSINKREIQKHRVSNLAAILQRDPSSSS